MAGTQPSWRARGDTSLPFVLSVCGGGAGIERRLTELPEAQVVDAWREPREGWLEADFEASPAVASNWLCAIREADQTADIYIQPRDELGKRLLICDMDMTIVAAETLDEIAAVLGIGDRIAAITGRAMRGEIDFNSALRERITLLAGQPESVFEEVAKTLALNPGARELIQGARAAGVHTILISGGFEQVAGPVARELGFDEVHCNRLEIDAGNLTGGVVEPIVNGDFKRDKLVERARSMNIPLAACCAIGDGANDMPMLQSAGLGIAYHGKPILRNAATCCIDHTDLASALLFMGLHHGSFHSKT